MPAKPKLKIKKGDVVIVRSGRDRGKSGEVIAVYPGRNRALVRGINIVRRHYRQTPRQEGGIIPKEASIHVSNIALADPADGRPVRIGFRTTAEGKKLRFARRSGELIDVD